MSASLSAGLSFTSIVKASGDLSVDGNLRLCKRSSQICKTHCLNISPEEEAVELLQRGPAAGYTKTFQTHFMKVCRLEAILCNLSVIKIDKG